MINQGSLATINRRALCKKLQKKTEFSEKNLKKCDIYHSFYKILVLSLEKSLNLINFFQNVLDK